MPYPAHTLHAPSPALPDAYTLLNRAEAAAVSAVTTTTLDRRIDTGVLPVVRFGHRILVRRAALDAYLTAHDPAAPAAPAPSDLDRDALLTYAQAVRLLRVSMTTTDRLESEGSLSVMRINGRRLVRAGALADLIDRSSHPATAGPLAGRHA
ncbi:hypothetical protein AB0K08_16845 [Citricoccus sp. NPDC055426]|uniref:hypothetical protein n=1 Tax=Citricoccus sp. NPDC055426 TaxID=3155536 RepID=UPI00341DB7C4